MSKRKRSKPTEPAEPAEPGTEGTERDGTAIPSPEPEPEQPAEESQEPQSYQDSARDAIYARARERREAQQAEDSERPGVELLEEVGGSEEGAQEPQPVVASPPAPAPGAPTALQALVSGAERVNIRVYGEEQQATRAEVLALGTGLLGMDATVEARLEAGLAELQKHEAADIRLERSATREASIREREIRLRAAEQRLSAPAPAPTLPAAQPAPSPQGVSDAELDEEAARITRAIYAGNEDVTQEQVKGLLKRVSTTPAVDVQALVRQELAAQRAVDADAPRREANRVFNEECTDLSGDETGRARAKVRFVELTTDPTWAAKPAADQMREAARRAREDLRLLNGGAPAPARAPAPGGADLAVRRERKAAAALAGSGGGAQGRAPQPAPTTPATRSQVVQQMQKDRGQLR